MLEAIAVTFVLLLLFIAFSGREAESDPIVVVVERPAARGGGCLSVLTVFGIIVLVLVILSMLELGGGHVVANIY